MVKFQPSIYINTFNRVEYGQEYIHPNWFLFSILIELLT